MPLDLNQNRGPIDETDVTFHDFFEDLQGNILSGHGRKHAVHFFLHFKAGKIEEAQKWIAKFASNYVTSALDQLEAASMYREKGIDAGVFGHFSITYQGYIALGIEENKIPTGADLRNRRNLNVKNVTNEDGSTDLTLDPAPDETIGNYSNVFKEGMPNRQRFLLDPPQETWEEGYKNTEKPIHAMFLLAADDPAEMIAVERAVLSEVQKVADILTGERGFSLKKRFNPLDPPDGVAVEHFGYVDGVSQPLFLKKQADREVHKGAGSFWDPRAPLNLVLVPDPNGTQGISFGSFLVYRKLEQNVSGFRRAEQELADELNISSKLSGAMAVGRFKDGTPLVLQPGDGARPIPNDFNYAGDTDGLTCPFHAHVRKTNPRLESVNPFGPFAQSEEEELGHRIARRGIPYGGSLNESNNPDELPTGGVGLLFFCYQSDIWEQFEFIQRFWSNNPNFLESGLSSTISNPELRTLLENDPRISDEEISQFLREQPNPRDPETELDICKKTGLDAVIGQSNGDQEDPIINEVPQPPRKWPQAWGKSPKCPVETDFAGFVKLKGGEYFFSPCISFLSSLG